MGGSYVLGEWSTGHHLSDIAESLEDARAWVPAQILEIALADPDDEERAVAAAASVEVTREIRREALRGRAITGGRAGGR